VFDDTLNQEYADHIVDIINLFWDPHIKHTLDMQPIELSAMLDKNCAAMCGKHDNNEKDYFVDFTLMRAILSCYNPAVSTGSTAVALFRRGTY